MPNIILYKCNTRIWVIVDYSLYQVICCTTNAGLDTEMACCGKIKWVCYIYSLSSCDLIYRRPIVGLEANTETEVPVCADPHRHMSWDGIQISVNWMSFSFSSWSHSHTFFPQKDHFILVWNLPSVTSFYLQAHIKSGTGLPQSISTNLNVYFCLL